MLSYSYFISVIISLATSILDQPMPPKSNIFPVVHCQIPDAVCTMVALDYATCRPCKWLQGHIFFLCDHGKGTFLAGAGQ